MTPWTKKRGLPLRLWQHFERRVRKRIWKLRFLLDCKIHDVSVRIGTGVDFAHPVRVWGFGGSIIIGNRVHFAYSGGSRWLGPIGIEMRTENAILNFADDVWIMRETRFICSDSISIGRGATIGEGCLLLDADLHNFTPGKWDDEFIAKPIVLEEESHLAPNVTILKGVKIGKQSVIGNRSVVQRTIPSRAVALGNPARVVLRYPDDRDVV